MTYSAEDIDSMITHIWYMNAVGKKDEVYAWLMTEGINVLLEFKELLEKDDPVKVWYGDD